MKLFVSDYDRTFDVGDMDQNITSVLRFQEKGNLFVIATGRDFSDFKKVQEQYHFPYDYAIINHGTTVLDKYDNILYNEPIPKEIMDLLKEELKVDTFHVMTASGLKSKEEWKEEEVTKLTVHYMLEEDAKKKEEELRDKYYETLHTYLVSPVTLEIIAKNTNKRIGIEFLSKKLHINEDDIYTIGDGQSDIPMIRRYHGGVMKNGLSEVKDYAEGIYESVSEYIEEVLSLENTK